MQNHSTISPKKQPDLSGQQSARRHSLTLRQRLCSAPILAFPNFSKPFILDTDASNTGIGGVLSQLDETGSEHVITYASQTLSKAERRYCVTRRELLAVVTFTQQFHPYLLGRQFMLRTDHGSLTWLQLFKEPEGQLARWLEKLQEYQSPLSTDRAPMQTPCHIYHARNVEGRATR